MKLPSRKMWNYMEIATMTGKYHFSILSPTSESQLYVEKGWMIKDSTVQLQ